MTATRKAIFDRALAVQNHEVNAMVDITTFVVLAMDDEQAERHVAYYEERAARGTVSP